MNYYGYDIASVYRCKSGEGTNLTKAMSNRLRCDNSVTLQIFES